MPSSRALWLLLLLIGCRSRDAPLTASSNEAVSDSALVSSESAPTTASARAPERFAAATREYEIRVGDKSIAAMTIKWEPLSSGGYRITTDTVMTVKKADRGGDAMSTVVHTEEEYTKDFVLVSSSELTKEGDIEEREAVTIEKGALHAVIQKPSHKDDRTLPLSADWANELAVFQSLRAQALAGAPLPLLRRYSSFDSEDMAFTPHTLTIEARTKVDTPTGSVDAWRIRTRDEKEGEEIAEMRDDIGLPLRAEIGAVTVVLKGSPGGSGGMLEVDSMIPVEGSIDARATSARLDVMVKGDAATTDPIFSSSPYQAVERAGDVYKLTLSARRRAANVAAPKLPMTGLTSDLARFLGPTARSQSADAGIAEQSKKIVAGEVDSDKAARKIVRWVFQTLDKRDGARGAASAVETLKANAGDCTEHTALTVALARAAGIPARAAGGIVLIPGRKPQAGYHAWPELWLGEWVVMDPALGDLDTGPRYLLLGYDEPGEARGEAKLVRLLGRATIRMR